MLIKYFKYFDLDNSGECSRDEWLKALNKIGVTGFNDEKLLKLYDIYDVNKPEGIDYKEFVRALFHDDEEDTKVKKDHKRQRGDLEHEHQRNEKSCALEDSQILEVFRKKLK